MASEGIAIVEKVVPLGPPARLSRREIEVLDCIQLGLTNRQIAQRLFVSTSTVNKHVQHVLRKLAVRNRVQAARYVRGRV